MFLWAEIRERLPTQRTVTGRLAVEAGLVVAGVTMVGESAGRLSALSAVDRYYVHYVLALLAAGIGAAAVAFGHTAGRIAGNRRAAWLIPALAIYCIVVVPSTALPPGGPQEVTAPRPALLFGCITVAVLLLTAIRPPARASTRDGWLAAVACALLILAFGALSRVFPGTVPAPTSSAALNLVVLLGWCTVSTAVVVAGYRAGSSPLWRVGLGFGVIASAHVYRAFRPEPITDPSLVFAALRLLGVVVVLLGMAQLLRRELGAVLTERFAHQEELLLANIRAEQLAQDAAEREHELRNGISGLMGITQLLGNSPGGERARSAAIAELRRLTDLLDRRPRSHTAYLYCPTEVVQELAALWRVTGVNIEVTATPGLMAVGRPPVLAQVLTNLLTNCARHAPGAMVRIVVRRDGGAVVVQVRDDGPGLIAPAPTAGAGIGLRISRRLLRGEGGELRVHPRDRRWPGYTVSIELVAGPSEPRMALAVPSPAQVRS